MGMKKHQARPRQSLRNKVNNPAYLAVRTNPGTITNQLEQQRWKSTLHSRGFRPNFYAHKRTNQAENRNQVYDNDSSNQFISSKITASVQHNPRSASFQPSVIRRREGNRLKEVDLQSEMVQNIRNRRKGNKYQLFLSRS